jgi:hypothetical protein
MGKGFPSIYGHNRDFLAHSKDCCYAITVAVQSPYCNRHENMMYAPGSIFALHSNTPILHHSG